MSGARKLLVFGGLALAGFGMLYGLHYALFVEHQTLDSMGGSLAGGFVAAAHRDMQQANSGVDAYAATRYSYVRQVDVHSHWIGLAMIMIVLGVVFDSVAFSDSVRLAIALALAIGSLIFPLGIWLQVETHGGVFASAMAIAGAGLVIAALAGAAVGFARSSA